MHLLRTAAGTFGVAASALVLTGTAASAAPPGDAIPISCDNGSDYTVLVNGNGDWTPGRDTASNTVLVPTSFGEFHGVVTLVETGEVLDEFTDPPGWKGKADKVRGTSVTCTFAFSGNFDDPELGGLVHFEGTGSVTGFTTPAR